MSTATDSLLAANSLDRLFYATGVLLDAQDFQAEQTYHRGRLARVLSFLHGSGTVAGLRVKYDLDAQNQVEQIVVEPGLAIDRMGRMIELPREACLRLDRWYRELAASSNSADVDRLSGAWHDVNVTQNVITGWQGNPYAGVVTDVFLRFVECERGKTPAFASGPFDALDAVQPSRIRDGYELELVPRPESGATLGNLVPLNPWDNLIGEPDIQKRRALTDEQILDAWDAPQQPQPEYAAAQADRTAVFLARVVIQADAPAQPNTAPARPDPLPPNAATVDNSKRAFLYTANAVARMLGV